VVVVFSLEACTLLQTIQRIKLIAAIHINTIATTQTLISVINQPETITMMLNKTAINPILEAILANLHIINLFLYKNTKLKLHLKIITCDKIHN